MSGIRVLEVAEMVAGPYAAKLLADLGAHVIKVEAPGGERARHIGPYPTGDVDDHQPDPNRSGLFLGLNTNKTSITIDLETPGGQRRLAELVAEADVVIHDLAPSRAAQIGLDADDLLIRHPRLVVAAITPYGMTGPQAEWAGCELTVVHGGGWGYLIPGDDPDRSRPPLTVPGWFSHQQAATALAMVALAHCRKARETGVGEFIDLSVMAQVTATLEMAFVTWSHTGTVVGRDEGRILTPWGIYECADGRVFLVTVEQDQWERLVEMMDDPDWARSGLFDTVADRAANQQALNSHIEQWTRQHQVEDLWHEGQARRICFAPVFAMADLARQPHLAERGFFRRVEAADTCGSDLVYLGPPVSIDPSPWALRRGAPALSDTDQGGFEPRSGPAPQSRPQPRSTGRRPLDGVRVVDLSWVWAGPYATMHLAALGADVIKVESAARPSLARRLPIHPPGVEPGLDTCSYFNQWDQGKRSIELDLTDPVGRAAVLDLICDADVVVENYATGVMDRLGLSDGELTRANPDLIIASITGYGHTGPLRNYMGYGPTTAPLSGFTVATGRIGEAPSESGLSIGDPAAGLATAFAIAAALFDHRPGDGQIRIDTSLWEATATNTVHAWMGHQLGHGPAQPQTSRNPAASPHGIFAAAGGDRWVAIACETQAQWTALAAIVGPELSDDPRFGTLAGRKANEDDLDTLVQAWTSTRDRWAIAEELQAVGVAAYPSLDCAEVQANPQHLARNFWVQLDHRAVGVLTNTGVAWRTRNAPFAIPRPAPLLGEHTTEILGGYRGGSST